MNAYSTKFASHQPVLVSGFVAQRAVSLTEWRASRLVRFLFFLFVAYYPAVHYGYRAHVGTLRVRGFACYEQ